MSRASSIGSNRKSARRDRRLSAAVQEALESRTLMAMTTIFSENFDGLNFGPNQEETVVGTDVWTNQPPAGWVKDDSGIPGATNGPENNGVTEWIGWTFPKRDWWVQAAGDQRRSEFTNADGGVMVADDDEWDDQAHPGSFADSDELYNAVITSPSISLAGAAPGSVNLDLDSSWRPEGFDDGASINNQTAIIEAVYSDETSQEILHWDSDAFGEFFHDHNPNEHVTLPLEVPEGATSVKLKFTLGLAANDWWWAVDNLAMTADVELPNSTQITQVFVNGNGLTTGTSANAAAFRTMAGIDPTYGYPVPAGTNQLKSIPWINGVNQVAIRFSNDVAGQIEQGDLQVRGSATATYTPSAFSYDPATKTAVWTLPAAVVNDKIRLVLDDAAVAGLDGEWQNNNAAEAFPSGDGTAGGDFDFRINVLGGDATQDGQINALDLAQIRQKLNKTAVAPGTGGGAYTPFSDITADGIINALDISAARQRINRRLPTADPAAPATSLLK